jgi:hypothetical protein
MLFDALMGGCSYQSPASVINLLQMQRTQSGPPANASNEAFAPSRQSRRIEERKKAAAAAAATHNQQQPGATGGTAQTAAKQEIQRVQSAIERCLHRYMPQKVVEV